MQNAGPLLAVADLSVAFATEAGSVLAVDRLSFAVAPGELLALVGESGCGKSVTALAVMGLLDRRISTIGGRVVLEGHNLLSLSPADLAARRGRRMAMVFQEPMSSLNPVMSIGRQIAEPLRRHLGLSASAARERTVELLDVVRIPDPRRRIDDYPHQLSGGMRQRVMIAMALAAEPRLLIADEPTTALDVTVQAQILDLIQDLRERLGLAVLLITHDLGVVAETADRVIVMYAGRKAEEAGVHALFARPSHPYTLGLLRSMPPARRRRGLRVERLAEIPGAVPRLQGSIAGCTFAARCAYAEARCTVETPPLVEIDPGHGSACWATARLDETVDA